VSVPGSSIALLVVATTLWGTSAALIAVVASTKSTGAAVVAASGALTLLFMAGLRHDHPWRTFSASRSLYFKLGLLEGLNMVLYFAALRFGPLPVVVALHLTAPVLIITTQVVRRRRALNIVVIAELLLVDLAIWLVTARHPEATTTFKSVAGCVLALGSASCVALLVTVVARESAERTTVTSAGLQLLLGSLLSSPLLAFGLPSLETTAWLVAIGALLFGPGFALYWRALKRIDATTASIIGLNEAVIATVVGALLTGRYFTISTIGAGALVLLAVALEVGVGKPLTMRK
jgi:drug/metabolite transporter (DMT)-like permease